VISIRVGVVIKNDEKGNFAKKLTIEMEIPTKKEEIFINRVASEIDIGAVAIVTMPSGRMTKPIIGIIKTFEKRVIVDILLK